MTVALLLGVLVPVIAAQAAIPNGRAIKTRDEALRRQFEDAVDLFIAGQFRQAEGTFRELARHPMLSQRGQEVVSFMIGKCLYAQQDYLSCREHFNAFIDEHQASQDLAAANIYVGHCCFHAGDILPAIHAYAAALDVKSDDAHREIALSNLEPLIRRSLSSSDVEYLLTNLGSGESTNWIRVWIADRWMEEGRVRLAIDLYTEVADKARRSQPGRLAQERLENQVSAPVRQRITVGMLAPLTGDFESYGREMAWAAQLAAETTEGTVKIVLRDSRGDSARAVQLVDSLIEEHCQVVIGPLLPEGIQGTLKPFEGENVVQVLPLARREGYTEAASTVFQMSTSPAEQARFLADVATRQLGIERLCVLASDSPEGREAATAFAAGAKAQGAAVLPVQYFNVGDTDFGEQLRTLKQQAAPPGSDTLKEEEITPLVDGMLIWGDPEDLVLIVPQVVFHRFRVYYFGPAAWGDPSVRQRVRSGLDSTYFISYEWVDQSRLSWRTFERSFRDKWGVSPGSLAGRVYDVIRWLGSIGQNDPSKRRIVQLLEAESGFDGVTGHWRFGADHMPEAVPLLRYQNGEPVPVEIP